MKKIKIIALIVILGFIIYQSYFHITNGANTSLIVDSQNKNYKELAILYINGKEIDTINFDKHYPYMANHDFSWGKNKIEIRGIENKSINYETTINYIGLYTWNLIQYRTDDVSKKKHYTQPRFR